MFAPYLDVTQVPVDVLQIRNAGVRYLILAFVNANQGCTPSWAGTSSIDAAADVEQIVKKFRARGGEIIVAFGGYNGTELAQSCGDDQALSAAYAKVVRKYNPVALDFDIEHLALDYKPSIARRSRAIKALTRNHPALQIVFTLPATPSGLTAPALDVLKSAKEQGVRTSIVNVMAMNYGEAATSKDMGANAIHAVEAAREQLKHLGMNARLGVTPMIGMNNTANETFTPSDATTLLQFVRRSPDVNLLSFWSVGRDNGSCPGTVAPKCSGIAQEELQFTKTFAEVRSGR